VKVNFSKGIFPTPIRIGLASLFFCQRLFIIEDASLIAMQFSRHRSQRPIFFLLGFSNKADCFDLKAKTVYSNVNVLFYNLQVSS
jgi:hypothetical protein